MEHHILARFAQVILVLYTSIIAGPVFGFLTGYFFLFGWFTDVDENNKYLGGFENSHFREAWSPKFLFKFAMLSILVQLILGAVFIELSWGIFLWIIFSLSLFFGIFSSKTHIEEAQEFISNFKRSIFGH